MPPQPTYQHGLLRSYPCCAIRTHRSQRNPRYYDGVQCVGVMCLQPVVAQRDDVQLFAYLCGECGRVSWIPTYDACRSSEQVPT